VGQPVIWQLFPGSLARWQDVLDGIQGIPSAFSSYAHHTWYIKSQFTDAIL